ncbi:MAG TPA: hypothetical protein VL527_07275 [Dongiaceae bacterium]|jgi:hypothetical protein|nr:hypothetical protein [Dongiaceae bacterium]
MFSPVATKDPAAVEAATQAAYLAMFPQGDRQYIPRIFSWARACFTGQYADYQPIDARYHDFEHTLQGALCMARLLYRRHVVGAAPALPQRLVELGLLAILLHDTGYLKSRGDAEGTGAKYTITHVNRSADFAARLLQEKGFAATEILAVQNMIRCTGLDTALTAIPFQSKTEEIVGHILGTSDLLGQMAADDYVQKLPILYSEFAEAAHYTNQKNAAVALYSSVNELLTKTPGFWDNYVKPKLDRDFSGQFHYFNDPYPDGPNWYFDKVEANIRRLRERLAISPDTSFTRRQLV